MQARSMWTKIITLTALAILIAPAIGLAAPGKAPANTHLGVPPDNLVTLVSVTGGIGSVFKLLGTPSNDPFLVPSGQVLIVTDIDSKMNYGVSLVINLATEAVAFVDPGKSYHFTGGFVVPAGGQLSTWDVEVDGKIYIRGYLMTAK